MDSVSACGDTWMSHDEPESAGRAANVGWWAGSHIYTSKMDPQSMATCQAEADAWDSCGSSANLHLSQRQHGNSDAVCLKSATGRYWGKSVRPDKVWQNFRAFVCEWMVCGCSATHLPCSVICKQRRFPLYPWQTWAVSQQNGHRKKRHGSVETGVSVFVNSGLAYTSSAWLEREAILLMRMSLEHVRTNGQSIRELALLPSRSFSDCSFEYPTIGNHPLLRAAAAPHWPPKVSQTKWISWCCGVSTGNPFNGDEESSLQGPLFLLAGKGCNSWFVGPQNQNWISRIDNSYDSYASCHLCKHVSAMLMHKVSFTQQDYMLTMMSSIGRARKPWERHWTMTWRCLSEMSTAGSPSQWLIATWLVNS